MASKRVNVILDEADAAKLQRLAQRTYTSPCTRARSLLARALDEADPDPRNIIDLLDSIAGTFDKARQGSDEAGAGQGIPLADL